MQVRSIVLVPPPQVALQVPSDQTLQTGQKNIILVTRSRSLRTFKIPGHWPSAWHGFVSCSAPAPQRAELTPTPSCWQFRPRSMVPEPQVTEHTDQADHKDHARTMVLTATEIGALWYGTGAWRLQAILRLGGVPLRAQPCIHIDPSLAAGPSPGMSTHVAGLRARRPG